jgi:hypothetical protein
MAKQKGATKTGGRQRGTPNKTTVALKTAILNAFDQVGGEDYLVTVAKSDPRTFCTLLGRVLPTEVNAEINPPKVVRNFMGRNSRASPSEKQA